MKYTSSQLTKIFGITLILIMCLPFIALGQQTGGNQSPSTPTGGNQSVTPGAGGGQSSQPAPLATLSNPLRVSSVGGLVQNFVEIISYVLIILAVLALVWTGAQYIFARGDSGKMTELSNRLLLIVIGVAVVISARLIVQIVINTLSATGTVDPRTLQSVDNAARGN